MQEIKVLVDEARVAEFYAMFGRWLVGETTDTTAAAKAEAKPKVPWGNTVEDLALAKEIWGKLTDRAKGMFSILMDAPDEPFSPDYVAETVSIPNGASGVAGVLAWPGRYCAEAGREVFFRFAEDPAGGGSHYWMTGEVAALFRKARDGGT